MSKIEESLKNIHIYEQILKYSDEYISSLNMTYKDSLLLKQNINNLKREMLDKSEHLDLLDEEVRILINSNNQSGIKKFLTIHPNFPLNNLYVSNMYEKSHFEALSFFMESQPYNKNEIIKALKEVWQTAVDENSLGNIGIEHIRFIIKSKVINYHLFFNEVKKIENLFFKIKDYLEYSSTNEGDNENKYFYLFILSLMNINSEEDLMREYRSSRIDSSLIHQKFTKNLREIEEKDEWSLRNFYATLFYEKNEQKLIDYLNKYNLYISENENNSKLKNKMLNYKI